MTTSNYFEQKYESDFVSPRGIVVSKTIIDRVVSSLEEQRDRNTRRITGSFDSVIGQAWFILGGVIEYNLAGDARTLNLLHET